jgi:hypothetical protein
MNIYLKNPVYNKITYDTSTGEIIVGSIGFDKRFIGDISINYGSYEDTLYFGDCETITERSNITIGGLINNSKKWSSYNRDISGNLQLLYTNSLLRNNQKYRDFINVEILDPSYNIKSNSILKNGSKYYIIENYSRNYKRGDIKLTLEEFVTNDVSTFTFAKKVLSSVNGESTSTRQVSSSGSDGAQGTQGIQGTTGAQGIQGRQGTNGATGATGSQGAQGTQGIQGHLGIQGYQGYEGVAGAQGPQGTTGAQGIQGRQGTNGATGATGSQGAQGTQGIQGHLGIQGYQGYEGVAGAQGPQGTRGSQGTQGTQGRQGATGIGLQGTQGIQGIQGRQGTQGVQGNTGAGINWTGEWVNDYNYAIGDGVSYNGASYVAIQTGINHAPPDVGYWDVIAQGTQGRQGTQGTQGRQGAAPTTNVYTTTVNYSIPTAYMNSIFEVSSASARSIYVPAGSVTGDQIAIINIGTGIVTISPSTGSGAPTLKGLGTRLKSRWSAASAYYNKTYNNWTLIGDVST